MNERITEQFTKELIQKIYSKEAEAKDTKIFVV